MHTARIDDRGMDHQVVVDELGRSRGIGEDAADGAGDEKHVLRPVRLEPVVDGGLIAKVELMSGDAEYLGEASGCQSAYNRGAHQAAMPRDVDRRVARNFTCGHRPS